jgi:hypothetical protein
MVRGQIVLAKNVGYATGMIAEIISDTELKWARGMFISFVMHVDLTIALTGSSRTLSHPERGVHPMSKPLLAFSPNWQACNRKLTRMMRKSDSPTRPCRMLNSMTCTERYSKG